MNSELTALQAKLNELRAVAQEYWGVSEALTVEGDYGQRCARCGVYDGRHNAGCSFVEVEKRFLALLAEKPVQPCA